MSDPVRKIIKPGFFTHDHLRWIVMQYCPKDPNETICIVFLDATETQSQQIPKHKFRMPFAQVASKLSAQWRAALNSELHDSGVHVKSIQFNTQSIVIETTTYRPELCRVAPVPVAPVPVAPVPDAPVPVAPVPDVPVPVAPVPDAPVPVAPVPDAPVPVAPVPDVPVPDVPVPDAPAPLLFDMVYNGTGWVPVVWNGIGWVLAAWNGVVWVPAVWNGVVWVPGVWNGVAWVTAM